MLWGGEFGRTPGARGGRPQRPRPQPSRLHHVHGRRGASRGGHSHGRTDDYGYYAIEDKVHIHDLHATILHLLGLDHERLTYPQPGPRLPAHRRGRRRRRRHTGVRRGREDGARYGVADCIRAQRVCRGLSRLATRQGQSPSVSRASIHRSARPAAPPPTDGSLFPRALEARVRGSDMRRLALLPLTALALGLVVWTARVNAVQEPNPPIEVHRITDALHMLGSGVDDRRQHRPPHRRARRGAGGHQGTRATAPTSSGTCGGSPTSR